MKPNLPKLAEIILDRPRIGEPYPILCWDDAEAVAKYCNSRLPETLQAVPIEYSKNFYFRAAIVIEEKVKPKELVFERGKKK